MRNRSTSVERIEAAESTMDGHDAKAVLGGPTSITFRPRSTRSIRLLQSGGGRYDPCPQSTSTSSACARPRRWLIFLAIYLKFLLDDVTVVKEIAAREVYEQLLRIGEGDLIIGISFLRYSKRTISAMKFARDRGARCLGLTDGKVSPLNEISDVCLYTKSEMVSFLDSLVAPLSMINALIMTVSARDRTRTFETFRELENVWKEYEVYGTVES